MNLESNIRYIALAPGARIGAATIDVLLILAALPIVITLLNLFLECDDESCIYQWTTWVIVVVVITAYLLLCWMTKLATPGKIAFRAIIVDAETGANPSLQQCIKRVFCLWASCAIFGLGFVPIFTSASHQGWHDTFSHTMIVRQREKKHRDERPNLMFYMSAIIIIMIVILLLSVASSIPQKANEYIAALGGESDAYLAEKEFVSTCLSEERQIPTINRDLLEKHIATAKEEIETSKGRRSSLEVARTSLNAALSIDPCHARAYSEYARYFERIANTERDPEATREKALLSVSRAISVDPNFSEAYVLKGFIAHLLGDNDVANQSLDRAEKLGNISPWLHINRAIIKRDEGDYKEAAVHFRRAMDTDADDKRAIGVAMDGIAEYFQYAGYVEQAEEVYAKRVDFDPESALGHLRYARFLLCYRDDPERSLGEVAKVAELARGIPQISYEGVMAANHTRQWARHVNKGDIAGVRMAPKRMKQANALAEGTPLDMISAVCPSGPAYEQVRAAVDKQARE